MYPASFNLCGAAVPLNIIVSGLSCHCFILVIWFQDEGNTKLSLFVYELKVLNKNCPFGFGSLGLALYFIS